jgi:hypothetical protein
LLTSYDYSWRSTFRTDTIVAANPLGRKILDTDAPAFSFPIDNGQSATFRYRVFLDAIAPKQMNRAADTFAVE